MKTNEDLSINKGVELMLRRRVIKEPKRNGLYICKNFSLLKKDFQIKLEFTWRDTQSPKEQ